MKRVFVLSILMLLLGWRCASQEVSDSLMCELRVDRMIREALRYIGTPYVWAADGPDAFDCSGFVHFIFGFAGFEVKRQSKQLSETGMSVTYMDARRGDLVFFVSGTPPERDITHVGIIISDYDKKTDGFRFVHANRSSGCVSINNFNEPRFRNTYWGVRRIILCP